VALPFNILWFILGGFACGLAWLVGGAILAVTVVGLPWSAAALRIALFSFGPFGGRVVDRRQLTGRDDLGTGSFGLILNVIWFLLAGWYIALAHMVFGLALCVTVIGIPFGVQHFKLAMIALAPVGKAVIPT
jgi:uncharacterized membrane protein YccF (DUF307 family)